MIVVTQTQLRNKDTEAIILLRNEIKASFNTNAIDYFTISAVAEILYNKFKHKKHDIIYHTTVSYDGINKPFKIRMYLILEKLYNVMVMLVKKTFINILQDVQVMLFLITFLLILVKVLELYIFL